MSGFAAIIRFDGAPVEPEAIRSMTDAMAHRGPDAISHWLDGPVALGHCMLRTTAESLEEHQPHANEDRSIILAMDGRLDNWDDLRRLFADSGAILRNQSDAELLLRAYESWGHACLDRLEGDFAFVIWDAPRRRAFCARDRMGHKPFHYHWNGRILAAASDPVAILALPWIPRNLNPGLITELLADEYYSADETVWQGIMRLKSACQLQAGPDGIRIRSYWQPDPAHALASQSDPQLIDAYRARLTDAVRRASRSHCPVAFEVSGGLDSSAVFAIAHRLQRSNALPAAEIQGYTLSFPDDPEANELEYSRAVARHLGVEISEIPPTIPPVSWYRDWTFFYGELAMSPNGAMSWDLRNTARQRGCRVILGGLGGDEWQGADSRAYYAEELASRRWRSLAACFQADRRAAGFPTALGWLLRFGVVPFMPPAARHALCWVWRRIRPGSDPRVSHGAWLNPAARRLLRQRRDACPPSAHVPIRRQGQIGLRQALDHPRIALGIETDEKMASRLGIEVRQPMRSASIVQFAFSTPDRLRLRGWTNKYMHVHAMRGLLPDSVVRRNTKAQFRCVFGPILDPLENAFAREIPERLSEWLEPEAVRAVHQAYFERQASNRSSDSDAAQWILWNLFACDLFIRTSQSTPQPSPKIITCI